MVRIRLARVGLKGQPTYRIVVMDGRKARDSRVLENIGFYNPRTRPQTERIDEARALYWLSVGAQPSESVRDILLRLGTLERYERYKAAPVAEREALMQQLIEEGQAAAQEREEPPTRTNYPAPAAGESKIKAREAARQQAEAAAEGAEG